MIKKSEMLTVDGSTGEGGGQIVRTSLALAALYNRPVSLSRIRAGRKKPGLMRQHLTAARALADICSGRLEGDSIGSQELKLWPGAARPGSYSFTVGTAGSTTLILQTLLPVMLSGGTWQVSLEGGTHNPFAPPFEFLERSFFSVLRMCGAQVSLTLERPGFYPRGGGKITVEVQPAESWSFPDLTEKRKNAQLSAVASVAGLDSSIGRRELNTLARKLGLADEQLSLNTLDESCGPGNIIQLFVEHDLFSNVFTGFGRIGVNAGRVAREALGQANAFLSQSVSVDCWLADQLLIPMVLAGGGAFMTTTPSRHTLTNIDVIEQFTGKGFSRHAVTSGSEMIEYRR